MVYIFRVDRVVLKEILIFKAVNTKSLDSSDSWEYDHISFYWLAIVYLMKIYVRTAQVGLKTKIFVFAFCENHFHFVAKIACESMQKQYFRENICKTLTKVNLSISLIQRR